MMATFWLNQSSVRTTSSISHEFKGLTEIRDEKFRQDTEGNVAGMFKVLLKSGFWGLKHIPLTKVTLTFNLE